MPTIDVVRLDEDPHESTQGLRADTSTRGVDLEGAQITATYADGTTETLTWQAYDSYTNGGASGTDIDMSYGYDWHELTTTKLLTSLKIDLEPASSVFDTTFTTDDDPMGGSTTGSKNGYPFKVAPGYETLTGGITATYTGVVNLAGSPAEGDIYTTMILDFTGLAGGGLLGDLVWNSDIDTMKVTGDLKPAGVACFTRGTLITTDRGDVPVETLKSGDRVLTLDHAFQDLRMVLSRVVGTDDLHKNAKLYPIRIMARAMGAGLPKRDLLVSRQHRMVAKSNIVKRMFGVTAALVAAIRLTEMAGIQVDDSVESVEYFHLIFERHEIVFAEGLPTESFYLSSQTRRTLPAAAWQEFATLFPETADPDFTTPPARPIPANSVQKRLVDRHTKNAKALFSA